MLVLDMRSVSSRSRHWIKESIHFRVPTQFVQAASLDQIAQALANPVYAALFARWSSACCLVCHTDDVEFTWECPAAQAVYGKLKQAGWAGSCVVLKGKFRHFRRKYPQHVSSQPRPDTVNSEPTLSPPSPSPPSVSVPDESRPGMVQQYDDWLERARRDAISLQQKSHALMPSAMQDRRKVTEEHERKLTAELYHRLPVLCRDVREQAQIEAGIIPARPAEPPVAINTVETESRGQATTDSDIVVVENGEPANEGTAETVPQSPLSGFVKVTPSGEEDVDGSPAGQQEQPTNGLAASSPTQNMKEAAPLKKKSKWRKILDKRS